MVYPKVLFHPNFSIKALLELSSHQQHLHSSSISHEEGLLHFTQKLSKERAGA